MVIDLAHTVHYRSNKGCSPTTRPRNMTLDQVHDGVPFVIDALSARGEIRKRLVDMGFTSGAQGTVLRRAPLGGPIELRIGRTCLALRINEARDILVATPDA